MSFQHAATIEEDKTANNIRDGVIVLSVTLLLALFATIAYISFHAPPSGDTWGHVVRSANRGPIELFDYYLRAYFQGNPRIGQYLLSFAGYSQTATAVINTGSILLALVGGFVVAVGRLPNILNLGHVGMVYLLVALTIACGTEMGQIFFYVPYNANYVFGFGVLLALLAMVRLYGNSAPSWVFPATILLGFLAGLSNEHTPPFFLGVGLLAIIVQLSGIYDLKLRRLHYVAFAALLCGYLALYFAPGQTARYDGAAQQSPIMLFLADPLAGYERMARYLFANSVPYYVAGFSILGIGALIAKRRGELNQLFWPALMLAASCGIAATTMVSPKLGHRLMFASYFALSIGLAGMLYYFSRFRLIYPLAAAVAVIYCGIYFQKTMGVYQKLDAAFVEFERDVAAAHQRGDANPVFDAYDFDFRKTREYTRADVFLSDPEHRLNRMRAKFYGFESVSFNKPVRK